MTPHTTNHQTHPSAVEYRLPDRKDYWHASSVIEEKDLPVFNDRRQFLLIREVPFSNKGNVNDSFTIKLFNSARSVLSTSLISNELPNEIMEIDLDEDWVFKPKPVKREKIEITIDEVRDGSLKNLSLSLLEDFEY